MDFVTIASILLNFFLIGGLVGAFFEFKNTFKKYSEKVKYLHEVIDDYCENMVKYEKLWESQKVSTNRYKSQLTRRNKRIENLLLKIETLCKK